MITKSKWICIECNYVNKGLLTIGKVYEVTTDTAIDPFTNADLSISSFISDNGQSYLIDLNNKSMQFHNDFIPLEEYRQRQLDKILK